MPPVSRRLVAILSAAAGATVANLYYCQPLLGEVQRAFHADARAVGAVPTLAQVGYALGMLLVVPLGDVLERRALVLRMTALTGGVLVVAAAAPSLAALALAHLVLGLVTCVPQLLVPMAADLAAPAERGRVVGTVMSGLLVGILLSRTVSGFVAGALGWRAPFWVGAVLTALVWATLRSALPVQQPTTRLSYAALLASCLALVRRHPALRLHAALGGLAFAAFSAFWVTLVFQLGALPAHYGARTAGAYGVIGVVGALAAPLVGRVADRREDRTMNALGCAVLFLSFGVAAWGGGSLVALAVAVVLLDFGTQASHINNQARIFALDATARSRLNTVYMVTYFVGGALGSLAGAAAWSHGRWPAVCALGAGLSGTALLLLGWTRWTGARARVRRHASVT